MFQLSLLLVSVFCSAFLSKLGDAGCNIDGVFGQIKSVLESVESPVADLSYSDTLTLTKNLTSIYFTSSCGTPSFCYAYDDFSHCLINKDIYTAVETGIQVLMKDVDTALENPDDLNVKRLSDYGDQIESLAKLSFTFTYRYASVQMLLCTNLLLLRNLAVKLPGNSSTASEQLIESLNLCTNKFNDNEFTMLDTLHHVTIKQTSGYYLSRFYLTVSYSSDDHFSFKCSTFGDNAGDYSCSCGTPKENEQLYVMNPVKQAYKKVFNPGYCEMREKLSIFVTPSVIQAVQCHDVNLYLLQEFTTGDWHIKDFADGPVVGVYYEANRAADGIALVLFKDAIFIDTQKKRVIKGYNVICNNVTFLTRCDIGVPEPFKLCN